METGEQPPQPQPQPQSQPQDAVVTRRYQLHYPDTVDLPPNLTELDFTAGHLSKLDERIKHLTQLKKLSLRQNLFDDSGVEPLCQWDNLSDLEELILRDNKLANMPDVSIFKNLFVFDVSVNEISSLSGLSKLCNKLRELYVSKNKITKIEEIEHLHELQVLELGSNNLRVMENLETFINLQELWLCHNQIETVNLCGLKCIKKLSLQSNRLTSMKGFEECVTLVELYLSHNSILEAEGVSGLVNLRVLDVSSNKLTSLGDIKKLRLKFLCTKGNQIASGESMAEKVSSLDQETIEKVIRQVELYFSLDNLPKMWGNIYDDGMASLRRVCLLREMKGLLKVNKTPKENTCRDVAQALRTSSLLVVSEDGTKVGSKFPYSEQKKFVRKIWKRTLVASPFPPALEALDIQNFFSELGNVRNVEIIRPCEAVVQFEKKKTCKAILEQQLSYMGTVLVLKSMIEHSDNCLKEREAKRKRKLEEMEARIVEEVEVEEPYNWVLLQPRMKLRSFPCSLINRYYRKLNTKRMVMPPHAIPIASVFRTRFRNGIRLPENPIYADATTPVFLVSWVIPGFHYIISGDKIPESKYIAKSKFFDLVVHFIHLFSGNPIRLDAPEPSLWDPKQTQYMRDRLGQTSHLHNQPTRNSDFLEDRYNDHLSKQNILSQGEAMEMIVALHEQFNMANLLKDVRAATSEFIDRDGCYFEPFAADHEKYPKKYMITAFDLVTLIRDVLGPTFFPYIAVKAVLPNEALIN